MNKIAIATFAFITFLFSCSKKNSDSTSGTSSVSFTFTDAGRTNLSDTSINCNCQFKAVAGGNNGTNVDTTHGYVFTYTGNKQVINLSFEIPQLVSGNYSYTAFSTTWPRYLSWDQWMLSNQTFIYTQIPEGINLSKHQLMILRCRIILSAMLAKIWVYQYLIAFLMKMNGTIISNKSTLAMAGKL